mmetsp:Transcript_2925/g.6333  ORF Transcript_2925/g.6333 Transcript_2925/m.6333 type:complete len:203 (+) Transcript_2925:369-977(+)
MHSCHFEGIQRVFTHALKFLHSHLSYHLGRRSQPIFALLHHRSGRYHRSRTNNGILLDHRPIQHLCRCTHDTPIQERGSMHNRPRSNGDIIPNNRGEIPLDFGNVNDRPIAHGGILPNHDLVNVSPYGGAVPNARVLSERNIANDGCVGGDKGREGRYRGRDTIDGNEAGGGYEFFGIFADLHGLAHVVETLAHFAGGVGRS